MQEKSLQRKAKVARAFNENPYDLETIYESISIASRNEKELQYFDKLITELRLHPEGDLTSMNYRILSELNLIKLPD